MQQPIITQLIQGTYRQDLEAVPVKQVLVSEGVAESIGQELAKLFDEDSLYLVVCDANTRKALGEIVYQQLLPNARILELPGEVEPNDETAEAIKNANHDCDVLVAVGSGTINDLCKYASFVQNKPYVVCATAPSMNGYLSANAAIRIKGYQESLSAQLPQAVYADLNVLANAPKRLVQSGFGDLLCRSTAQFDWLLSHKLLGTAYTELPFEMLQPYETPLLEGAEALVSGNKEVMHLLIESLLVSGLGMYLAGGSYPASQAEHMVAHTMMMVYGDKLPKQFHGEQIAVTTLHIARLQEAWPENGVLELPDLQTKLNRSKDAIVDFFGNKVGEACIAAYEAKIARIAANWQNVGVQELREALEPVMMPPEVLQAAAQAVGLVTEPEGLGWQQEWLEKAVRMAPFSRDRFTVLDFV